MADARPEGALSDKEKKQSKAEKKAEGQAYLEALLNAANRINIWRNVSFLLLFIIFGLMFALIRTAQTLPVRLVTYEMATGNQMIEVGPQGEGGQQYLGYIAEADLKIFTDWRPETVVPRFKALDKRMTARLHATSHARFAEEAKEYEKNKYTQYFFISQKRAVGKDTVVIDGVLQRWVGEIEVLNEAIRYTLDYQWSNGLPMLDAITPEQRK